MKPILRILLIGSVAVILALIVYAGRNKNKSENNGDEIKVENVSENNIAAVSVVAENLKIPWDLTFLPGGDILVTERPGKLVMLSDGNIQTGIDVPGIEDSGEGGLLGIAIHPDFESNSFVYLYMTTSAENGQTQNRVTRYRFEENVLKENQIIIDKIPGAVYHDGGRIDFGPDGYLYVATGDATTPNIAQDLNSLGGKILRVRDDGSIPEENISKTAVYSYGHRNPQGLAWDSAGRLWSAEHGRSGIRSGFDEINLIKENGNYGWPEIEGDKTADGMTSPALHSGSSTTWAPASAAILGNKLFFGGLLGESLYEATLDGEQIVELKSHFEGEFGRIRTVRIGPDEMLYITTSNTDGRGKTGEGDDKIIKINPENL